MKIILASKSPRRRELISRIFSEFEIVTAQTDETLPENMHPQKGVELLALRKGEAVLSSVPCDALVISSDTLVEIDGVALGKPRDEADALRILSLLSGRMHRVHTGVAVHYCGKAFSGVDTAYVKFRNFSKEEALKEMLRNEFKYDSVQTEVVDITKLGLMEITRKKVYKTLKEQLEEAQ